MVMSVLAQQRIKDETAAIMFAAAAQMRQDLLVRAAGFFQRVGEDSEPGVVKRACGKGSLVVSRLRQSRNNAIIPRQRRRGDDDAAEGSAENIAEYTALNRVFRRFHRGVSRSRCEAGDSDCGFLSGLVILLLDRASRLAGRDACSRVRVEPGAIMIRERFFLPFPEDSTAGRWHSISMTLDSLDEPSAAIPQKMPDTPTASAVEQHATFASDYRRGSGGSA